MKFELRRRFWTSAFALLLIGSLTACNSSDIPDLKGRYIGERKIEGQAVIPLLAQVPSLKRDGKSYAFEFDLVTAVIPSGRETIHVRFSKDDKASVVIPSVSMSAISLNVSGDCAKGVSSVGQLSLCWTDQSLAFELAPLENDPRIEIVLNKSNELPPLSDLGAEHPYTIEEIMARSKFNSYSVTQEAERVFQAKKGISIALGNLLPHFNLRDLFPVITGAGPLGLVEIVGDLLPFLFPSNWYKWKATKAAYRAERKSFASLRGNGMNQIEGLFYVLSRDVQVRGLIEEHFKSLTSIHEMVVKRERYGQMPQGSSDRFYLSVLEVQQDLDQMDLLLSEELTSLSHGVALPPASGIQGLAPIKLPDPATVKPIDVKTILPLIHERSYELATLGQLIEAAKSTKTEFAFGFLDPLSSSTLGFGYAATLQVSKSKIKELESKRSETSSLIEKQTADSAKQFNGALKSFQVSKTGLEMSRNYLATLHQRLRLGDDTIGEDGFVEELRETARQVLKFQASRATALHTLMVAQSKVNRLLLEGYYTDLEVAVPVEEESE